MNLTLTLEERKALEETLGLRLRALQDELVHTDDRDYRRSVRETLDRVDAVARRISEQGGNAEPGEAPDRPLPIVRAANIMRRHPLTAWADDLVLDLAARMAENVVRHMPIVDRQGCLIGMVSDRDIREAIGGPMRLVGADGQVAKTLMTLAAGSIMSANPVSVTGEVPLIDLARLFAEKPIGAVPVVNDEQRVLGIVSYVDVLSRICGRR